MTITKHAVADRIAAYLHHEITLAELVDWAEGALMDGEFDETDAAALSQVAARKRHSDQAMLLRYFAHGTTILARKNPAGKHQKAHRYGLKPWMRRRKGLAERALGGTPNAAVEATALPKTPAFGGSIACPL
jgi:hypothetical protein